MPRVATTVQVSNPQRKGYDFRLDDNLFRAAIGPGREMSIQSSDVQAGQQVNVKQNPEDFTSNLGRIYSRNNYSSGEGLDRAHRANGKPNDNNRFFDSQGVDVFHGDTVSSYHTHLLYTTQEKDVTGSNFTSDNNFLIRLQSGDMFTFDNQAIYKSTDNGANWTTETSTNVSYKILGAVAYGNNMFIVTGSGTNTQLIHYNGTSYSDESLGSTITGRLENIFYSKGILLISGVTSDNVYYLWHADPVAKNFNNQFTAASSSLLVTAEDSFSDAVDAGAVTLVSNENGIIYSIKDDAGTPKLQGQTEIPFEKVHSIAASEGIVFFGTEEKARTVGRFYRADLTVADNLYVLTNRQLIREWVEDSVDTTPHHLFVSRDSIYMGVRESTTTMFLWRYYLPTGGFARDLKTTGTAICQGITQANGKFVISSSDIFVETSTYETEGYIILSPADFYTAEKKQFVGASIESETLQADESIELYTSTKVETINDSTSSDWKLQVQHRSGRDSGEVQLNILNRFAISKVVLKSPDGNTSPKLTSVQIRALARPELVVVNIPVNVSDRVERPYRKPVKVKNLGEITYAALKAKEGTPVTLEIYDPREVIRGVVEKISYPIQSNPNIGSVTQYAILTVRGTRQGASSPVTSGDIFGVNKFAVMRFG